MHKTRSLVAMRPFAVLPTKVESLLYWAIASLPTRTKDVRAGARRAYSRHLMRPFSLFPPKGESNALWVIAPLPRRQRAFAWVTKKRFHGVLKEGTCF